MIAYATIDHLTYRYEWCVYNKRYLFQLYWNNNNYNLLFHSRKLRILITQYLYLYRKHERDADHCIIQEPGTYRNI